MRFSRHPLFLTVAIISVSQIIGAPIFVKEDEFHKASQSSGSTLFQQLDGSDTGLEIENPYDDPQMWGKRYRAYMGGGMGSGLAAGDFDNDGLVDLFVNPKTKPGKLFRNLGNWKFEDVTKKTGLAPKSMFGWLQNKITNSDVVWGQGAVFADVNNDGWLDLFVCRNDAPNLLFINQKNGRFSEEGEKRGLAIVDGSVVGAFSDYDRDGWLDVLILTNQVEGTEASGRPDRLFRNNGDGYFTEVTESSGISGDTFGHSATWIDYNHDLWPDLYVANDFLGPDRFFHNNGDGTFSDVINEVVPHTSYSSMGADLGDINNDGYFDLLIADMATSTREKDRRGLAASRGDILRASTLQHTSPQYMRSALLLNTGENVFGEVACWAGVEATDWTWSIRFEDYDNDGWTDLHVTNGMVREANNSDMLNRMMRALSDQQRINAIKREPRLEESNLAFRNRNGNGFENVTKNWGLEDIGVSFGAATADFDKDGDLDIIYLNHEAGLSVFRNDCRNQHRIQVRLRGNSSNSYGIGAVVRLLSASGWQSKPFNVSRGYASGSEMVAHFGMGSDSVVEKLVVEWPSGIHQVFENLETDKAYLVRESEENIGILPSNPTPWMRDASVQRGLAIVDPSELTIPDREQPFIPYRTDRAGPGVVVANLNAGDDAVEEIYLSATPGSSAQVFERQGSLYKAVPIKGINTSEIEDGPPLVADFDGDGTQDLLITKASANNLHWPAAFQPVIYSNEGNYNFKATHWLPQIAINVGAVSMADIDADGDLDLFLGARSIPGHYPEIPQSYLLKNNKGRFEIINNQLPKEGKLGLIRSAMFTDVDQDGLKDLLIATEWDYVRYYHNDGNGHYSDFTEKSGFTTGGRGWWYSLSAADVNGDGQLDFAAGNLGLNTIYEASKEQPFTAFYGHFSASGSKHLIESVWDNGELYPLKSRNDIGTFLPKIVRKFRSNNKFAKATMKEVFGEKYLSEATPYFVDEFESGIYLSQSDGTYQFQAFPPMAQLGPIHGMVMQDLDADGIVDIVAVQNTDSAIPRFDGAFGVFLKGMNDGKFEWIHPTRSGFVVPGNARALTILDSNGDQQPDLFTTRYSGSSALFENQNAQAQYWSIKFKGLPNNLSAIGAVVTLQFRNSGEVSYQIGIGGSWYSQSSKTIFAARHEANPLNKVTVLWPDGKKTTHLPPETQSDWIIAEPSS